MGKSHRINYRIFDNETSAMVAEGSAEECADKLKINRSSFYAFVFRMKDNKKAKYRIETDPSEVNYSRTGRNRYVVYRKASNVLIVSGTAKECAAALTITIRSFYDIVSRSKKGIEKRYNIEIT